ncbi:hypothetical protein JD507_07055 [Aeromonas jandaei]|uniref:hypothetical protein n=1 Tax=Aeromonas jandaei TaxID=650 RepID=UPI00191D7653|nr:hypothetical protein [Aeromonas jandaei]MBL0544985.1 hypothetical protein [Aeromonas jandaei]
MLSLLLCASLWQFDAPVPAGEPLKEFEITHQEASPALRDRVADQLGHGWQAKDPGTRLTFSEPTPRYAGESPLTRMLNDRDDGWESRLQIEW